MKKSQLPHLVFAATLLLAAAFTGCATATIEQRQTLQNAAELAAQKQTLTDSQKSRKPLKPGQWVTVLVETLGDDDDLTLRTIKVLEASEAVTRIEVDSQSALSSGALATEGYVIEKFPQNPLFEYTRQQHRVAIQGMVFRRILVKKPDKEQEEWASEFLMFNKEMLVKLFLTGYIPDDARVQAEPCTSGYIESKLCYAYPYKLEFLDHAAVGRAHAHSEVPIVGILHAADEYRSYKVIAFGEDGATARLTY